MIHGLCPDGCGSAILLYNICARTLTREQAARPRLNSNPKYLPRCVPRKNNPREEKKRKKEQTKEGHPTTYLSCCSSCSATQPQGYLQISINGSLFAHGSIPTSAKEAENI